MPESVLKELPEGWRDRASVSQDGNLVVTVPHGADLLAPTLRRNEQSEGLTAAS